MKMGKQIVYLKVDEEDYEKMIKILSKSQHHLLADLVVESVLNYNSEEFYEKEKALLKEQEKLEKEKENMRFNCFKELMEDLRLSNSTLSGLNVYKENQILKQRLENIRTITNGILYRNVRLSKQYINDIHRMTKELDKEFPYYYE